MLCLVGLQEDVINANNQISSNLGLPFRGTITWAIPQQNYSDNLMWFFMMPPEAGWTREDGTYFSQEEMMYDVVSVDVAESQPDWFPPFEDFEEK